MDIPGASFNQTSLCLSLVSGDHSGFIQFGQALFKMSLGKEAEKLAFCCCITCMPRVVCVCGKVRRLEGVALIFNAGLCALSFVSTVKVPAVYVLGMWHFGAHPA